MFDRNFARRVFPTSGKLLRDFSVGIGQSIAACMREIGGTMMVIVVGADCRQAGGLSLPFRRKNRHRLREPAKMSWRNLGRSFSVTKFCTGCSPLLRFSTTFLTRSAADMKLISLMLCQSAGNLGQITSDLRYWPNF